MKLKFSIKNEKVRKLQSLNSFNQLSKRKKIIIISCFLTLIIATNVLISDYVRTDLIDFVWRADDATYIGVAYSFYKDNNFGTGFTSRDHVTSKSVDDLIREIKSVSSPQNGKGPFFFITLGSFYKLMDTQPPDIYYDASIFGTILSSIFLILFFYFVKTRFGLKNAILSSILLTFVPIFVLLGARVYPSALLLIFSICALFFLEKKTFHYVMFGLFSILAWLTHPFGIFLGLSYTIFLLINKEYRGVIISTLTAVLILSPWLYSNYYNFGDIGWGLFLPFSTAQISEYLSFLPSESDITMIAPYGGYVLQNFPPRFTPFEVFYYVYLQGFLDNYNMTYFVLFLFSSAFAFFKIEKLKKHTFVLVPFISIIILVFFLINNFKDPYLHGALLFALPILLIWVLWKKYHSFFVEPQKRIYLFIILFLFISLIGLYGTSVMLNRVNPEVRQIIFPLILMIPLSILGIEKIVNKFTSHRKDSKIIFFFVVGLIFVPIIFQMVDGINQLEGYTENTGNLQGEGLKNVNTFLVANTSEDSNFASNEPGFTFVNTARNSIGLPLESITLKDFEKFMSQYDISYLVSYDETVARIPSVDSLLEKITQWQPYQYYYTEFYNDGNSQILQVKNLLDAEISEPVSYIFKAKRLENEGKLNEANTIYKQIREFNPKNISISEKICSTLTFVHKFEYSIYSCTVLLKNDANNLIALSNLAISYAETGQIEKVVDVVGLYGDIFFNEPNNEKVLKSWDMTMSYLISVDDEYQKIIDKMFDNAKKLEEQHDYQKALIQYNFLSHLTEADLQLSIDSSYGKIRILAKLERYDDAFKVYDATIQIYNNEIRKLMIANQYNEVNDMQKSMINVMKGKANLLTNLEDYHKAQSIYNAILGYDKFDSDVWKKTASYHEKYDRLQQALHAYEFAHQLEPENDYLLEKIEELKDKIANIR